MLKIKTGLKCNEYGIIICEYYRFPINVNAAMKSRCVFVASCGSFNNKPPHIPGFPA